MMKATGQSKKATSSTGSYGIGKFAPFTVSRLRTVFISTIWEDDAGQAHHYVQGKAVLMSHVDSKNKTRRGTGFWGVKEQCSPVTSMIPELPGWLKRSDDIGHKAALGTTLSILGFSDTKNWQKILAANILENFFGAIHRGDLEVDIDGSIILEKETLAKVLLDKGIRDSISQQEGEPEKFETVSSYLHALAGQDDVFVAKHENQHLGECELRIYVAENMPKRVAVLRNGMLITESLPGLKRFSDFKEFAAVLQCTSSKGQALLRAMEPPRHDAFEPERLPVEKRSHGRTALKDLSSWVRSMLKRYAQDPVSEQTSLDELADFFADEAEEGSQKVKDENPAGRIIVRAKAVPPVKAAKPIFIDDMGALASKPSSGDDDGTGTESGIGTGTDQEEESDTRQGEGSVSRADDGQSGSPGNNSDNEVGDVAPPTPDEIAATAAAAEQQKERAGGGAPISILNVRAVVTGPTTRKIAFTPTRSGTIRVEFQDSGADSNYPLYIKATDAGEVKAGLVSKLKVRANKRVIFNVEFTEEFQGTIRIIANAV